MTNQSLILDVEYVPAGEIRFKVLDRRGRNPSTSCSSSVAAAQIEEPAQRLTKCSVIADSLDVTREQGERLFSILIPANVKIILGKIETGKLLLRLDSWCDRLPWEMLHDGREFLGVRFQIGRVISAPDDGNWGGEVTFRDCQPGSPAAMLVVGKRIAGLDSLDAEAASIQKLLAESGKKANEIVGYRDDADGETFAGYFSRYRVVHFCGHSEWTGNERTSGMLLDDGLYPLIRIRNLRGSAHLPELVFLNSCDSCTTTNADMLSGFHAAFLAAGIPWLIGCTGKVNDLFASQFAFQFYRELAAGKEIVEALRIARAESPHAMWGLYRLYGDPQSNNQQGPTSSSCRKQNPVKRNRQRAAVSLAKLIMYALVGLASVILVLYLIGTRVEKNTNGKENILFIP